MNQSVLKKAASGRAIIRRTEIRANDFVYPTSLFYSVLHHTRNFYITARERRHKEYTPAHLGLVW
jgi:hypothetical protein